MLFSKCFRQLVAFTIQIETKKKRAKFELDWPIFFKIRSDKIVDMIAKSLMF